MTSRDFCYWLQGYFEIAEKNPPPVGLCPAQAECIKAHLAMVFVHEIDPSFPKEQQAKLDAAHAKPEPLTKLPQFPTGFGGDGPGGIKYRC